MNAGCLEQCASPRDHAVGGEGDASLTSANPSIRSLAGVASLADMSTEGGAAYGRSALGPATHADGDPGAPALLLLGMLLVLIGLGGGLRALHGSLKG